MHVSVEECLTSGGSLAWQFSKSPFFARTEEKQEPSRARGVCLQLEEAWNFCTCFSRARVSVCFISCVFLEARCDRASRASSLHQDRRSLQALSLVSSFGSHQNQTVSIFTSSIQYGFSKDQFNSVNYVHLTDEPHLFDHFEGSNLSRRGWGVMNVTGDWWQFSLFQQIFAIPHCSRWTSEKHIQIKVRMLISSSRSYLYFSPM